MTPNPSTLTRDELLTVVNQCRALLPKWGQRITDTERLMYFAQAERIMGCWNDLSCALSLPEPAAEYAEHLAEHRIETAMDEWPTQGPQE